MTASLFIIGGWIMRRYKVIDRDYNIISYLDADSPREAYEKAKEIYSKVFYVEGAL